MYFSNTQIDGLRKSVSGRISPKRYEHTLGVERCSRILAKEFIPEYESELAAAALLHDISKEMDLNYQIELIRESGFILTEEDIKTVGVIHSFSAPIIIRRDFPEFATDRILDSVLKHTVGDDHMSTFDKIIFISDYIEDGRKYESCANVRSFLLEGINLLSQNEKAKKLDMACVLAIEGTEEALKNSSKVINSRMLKTKKSLLCE